MIYSIIVSVLRMDIGFHYPNEVSAFTCVKYGNKIVYLMVSNECNFSSRIDLDTSSKSQVIIDITGSRIISQISSEENFY